MIAISGVWKFVFIEVGCRRSLFFSRVFVIGGGLGLVIGLVCDLLGKEIIYF